jgi:hypothetical protein
MSLTTDIYDLIQPILTGTLIWADQNAPRPVIPYSMMKIMSVREVNKAHYSNVDNSGIQSVLGDREFTLNIQNFGLDAPFFVQAFLDKLRLTTNIDKFMAKKITAFDFGAVADISFLQDATAIEKRASVDIFMRYKSTLTDNVGAITTVNVEADDNSKAPVFTIIAVDPDL